MKLVDIGIGREYWLESRLGQIMHFSRNHLLFQTPHHGRGKHNIPDGAEAYDKKFHAANLTRL
jgi:hypothetical protein